MNPYLLEQLLAFYRTGTLSKAAESLYISQPALSQSMYRLEEQVGVPLFTRSKNKTTFNENGRLMAQYAEKILALQEEMLTAVREQALHPRSLRLASIAPGPVMVMEEILGKALPELDLTSQLYEDDQGLLDALRSGSYDMVVSRAPSQEVGIYSQELLRESLSLRLHKSHPLAQKDSLTFADLARQNILLLSELGFWTDFVKAAIPTATFIYTETPQSFTEIARMGNFPTFVTELTVDEVPDPDQVILPIREATASATFYLLLPEDQRYNWTRVLELLANYKNEKD